MATNLDRNTKEAIGRAIDRSAKLIGDGCDLWASSPSMNFWAGHNIGVNNGFLAGLRYAERRQARKRGKK